ncbi:MAG: methyltransferase domain-containing protein [Pseudomonadota bacterium]
MDAKLQRRIQRYGWDKAIAAYEAGWKESLSDAHDELLRQAKAETGESVLDIACGTGLITLRLAEAVGPKGCMTATDLSENMVSELGETAEALGFANITAFRADAEDLKAVPDDSMDLVTCALGLMYVPHPERAMAEALRILKPGGRAVMAVWGARRKCGWAEIFPIVNARVQSDVCPLFFRLGTGETLSHEMSAAGFSQVMSKRIDSVLSYRDDKSAIDAAFVGGPVALAYDRFDDATRASATKEYLASIRSFSTPDGYRIPGEFVVCSGVKTTEKPI